MNIVKEKEEKLKAETENCCDVLRKENKEEAKHQKVKVRNNKGTEKVEEKPKEVPLKDGKKKE